MGREENVLIFQDTERLSKTNGKLNADLKASASGQKLILETDALEKPNLNSVCSLSNLFFRFHTTTLTEACSNELKQHHL